MKKSVVFALAMLVLPAVASAQGGGQRGPGMMQQNVARLLIEKKADLALSDEQVAKLEVVAKSLEEKNAPIIAEVRAARQAGADRQTMMAKMQQIRTNADDALSKEIKPILSADQFTTAEKIIEEARPRRPGGGGRR